MKNLRPRNKFVIPTGAYPDFLPRSTRPTQRVRLSIRERRMKFAEATKFNRKSGGAQWRDLRFSSLPSESIHKTRVPAQVLYLRGAAESG